MAKLVALEYAEDERADGVLGGCRGHKAGDHELLPLGALRLDPVLAATRHIFAAGALGDHTFKTETAGMAQHHVAIFLKMLAVAQDGRSTAEELLKRGLAIDQRC